MFLLEKYTLQNIKDGAPSQIVEKGYFSLQFFILSESKYQIY
jgi:hypothetical protein